LAALERFGAAQSFELGKVEELFSDLKFFVETAFLRKVSDDAYVFFLERFAEYPDLAFVGIDNLIDNPYQGSLTRTVRPEQSEDTALGNGNAYIFQRGVFGITLGDIFRDKCFHVFGVFTEISVEI